ncbi:MAG: hypothetical protein AB7S41_12435 [Parvibaculaceae bacterium]
MTSKDAGVGMSAQSHYSQEQTGRRGGRRRNSESDVGTVAPSAFSAMAAAIIATLIAWQIATIGLSTHYAETAPTASLSLWAHNTDALAALIRNRIVGPDGKPTPLDERSLRAIREASRDLLAAEPLDIHNLRLLASLEEQAGHADITSRLMYEAGTRTVRDPAVNFWLLQQAAKDEDYVRALRYIDLLARASPSLRDQIRPILIAIAQDPNGSKSLLDILIKAPPWRPWFLSVLPGGAKNLLALQPLYLELGSSENPLQARELAPYLRRLVDHGFPQQAYYTWIQSLPAHERRAASFLYNGDFQRPQTNLVFDWSIWPISGASIAFEEDVSNPTNTALRIEFIRKRTNFRNVAQMILLPPGSYTLTGSYKAYDLLARRGLVWRVLCLGKPGGIVGESNRIRGTEEEWKTFEAKITIPDQNCDVQSLRLDIDARAEVESEISGSVWFDDLRIARNEVVTNSTTQQSPEAPHAPEPTQTP